MSQSRGRSGSPATEPSRPRGQVGSWTPRTTPSHAPPWTQRVPSGVKFRPLASLIAQLVHYLLAAFVSTSSAGFFIYL
jgi:hypothetical protein